MPDTPFRRPGPFPLLVASWTVLGVLSLWWSFPAAAACFLVATVTQAAQSIQLQRQHRLERAELEARLAKTQLQLLKMQLQPHFLFNTLNTIAELVHSDPDSADVMITRLGRLLRITIDQAGHHVVPLRRELEFIRAYVGIEKVRFQGRLEVSMECSPEALDGEVPTLVWQPALENAIRHGVSSLGHGRIVMTARKAGAELLLEIHDNGRGLPSGAPLREGVGLRNIRERVAQLYGRRGEFTLRDAPGGGAIASLRIPYTHCTAPHTPVPLAATPAVESPAGMQI